MNIIIYNPNSKGGNYKYAQYTAHALTKQGTSVTLVLPQCTAEPLNRCTIEPILISDNSGSSHTLFKKLHFFFRIFWNPIIFYRFIKKQPASKIIFNDFDQLTACIWVPLFMRLKKKHTFSVILHDPDRDAYPGGIKHVNRCMKAIMSLMDVAFFHEHLPEKVYYKEFKGQKITIPHGLYAPETANSKLKDYIMHFKGDAPLLCIPGNIRYEKNYHLIMEALQRLPDYKLLIAGSRSSSGVNIDELKEFAEKHHVKDRVLWVVRYLTESEFTAVLECSDLVLLYYKQSFTSQSGILNQIAPLQKNVLISDTQSALTTLAKEYNLGTMAKADDINAYIQGVQTALADKNYSKQWEAYLDYASWEKQSRKIVESLEGTGGN